MKRILTLLLVILLLSGGLAAWFLRGPIREAWDELRSTRREQAAPPVPRPGDYRILIEDARRWRSDLGGRYRAAADEPGREQVLRETREFLEILLPAMMRCWLGTPWDFNGVAEQPGGEGIACGYFVTTVLRDAGFRIDRYKVAKQPSQTILRTFVPRNALLLRVGVPFEEFAAEARALESGVHIIGLDTHVAFLVVHAGSFRFIHSSGSSPWCVVDAAEAEAKVLAGSNYRVLGNLTADREVLRRWLFEEPFRAGAR